jgi:hypothetical protein
MKNGKRKNGKERKRERRLCTEKSAKHNGKNLVRVNIVLVHLVKRKNILLRGERRGDMVFGTIYCIDPV